MTATTTTTSTSAQTLKQHSGKLLLAVLILLVLGVALILAVVVPRWPFRRADMRQRIESSMGATVQFGQFHQIFFPHPGCVIDNLVLVPSDPLHPKVTVKKLTIRGLYWGLIGSQKHLESLSFDGLQLDFPAKKEAEKEKQENASKPPANNENLAGDDTRFDEVYVKDSQIVFAGDEKNPEPRTYQIYQLVMKNFSTNGPIHFSSQLKLPEPEANVATSGTFGPINRGELGQSPLSGTFTMQNANLQTFHTLFGTVSASGSFNGRLGQLQVNGKTDTPNFGLTETGHSLPLKTEFAALVDGTKGNIEFQPINAVLGKTKLLAQGQLVQDKNKKRVLTLEISSNDARIEDLMFLFVNDKSPLAGPTQFKMKVQLPSSDVPFEKRVVMQAHFGIEHSKFTNSETQQKVSKLSENAQGNPKDDTPPTAVTNLSGDLLLKDGTANFSRLDGDVPGANVKLHGKYVLETHAVDLHGTLSTSVNLSQATTGFKAFLMKVVEFTKQKKKQQGATVPVKIGGTYDKPEFGLDAVAEK